VLHGFTGCPQSVRGLAQAFAAAGFTVQLPLLPGHGTTIDDMLATTWTDWSACAELVYNELAVRCDKVVVAGLSMGGSLAVWLAAHHPEIAGVVAINAAIDPPAESFREGMRQLVADGHVTMPAVGNDIADPNATELAYDATPIVPLLSLCDADDEIYPKLAAIHCPVLVMTSPQDHVVPPVSSEILAAGVSGPVERVTLERSFHVATLDYDKDDIEARAVDFALKATSS
jgi:carboxylesterase